jgi:glycosyltransferase involved in cell wall biosynthesis
MVLRQRHGWTEQDLVMVCVSRLSREKGLLDLLHAFRSVNSRLPSLRLMLVGEGPDRELLERMMHEFTDERRAVIHPATPNVGHFLAAADIFVLPSLHENQSFAILEAMAAGLPVLSTRVGGTPELVQHGVTGWLVPPSCPDQLAEGMALLAADKELRRRLGQAGRTAATRDHDFDDFLYRLDSVYSELLSTKGSGQRASSRN